MLRAQSPSVLRHLCKVTCARVPQAEGAACRAWPMFVAVRADCFPAGDSTCSEATEAQPAAGAATT